MSHVSGTPEAENVVRTQEWVQNTALQVGEQIGVSLNTACRCRKEVLSEINVRAQAELTRMSQGEVRLGSDGRDTMLEYVE